MIMKKSLFIVTVILFVVVGASTIASDVAAEKKGTGTYDQDSVLRDATEFLGKSTEGLAKVIEKAFKDYGSPNAYIKGQEAGGAITVGLHAGASISYIHYTKTKTYNPF